MCPATLGTVVSQGSYLNRSYIKDISIIFISKKEFFIFIVFYPSKTQFLFFLNFEFSLQDEAGWCVFFLCGIENYSHITMNIRRGQHPLAKIELKKKLSFNQLNISKIKEFLVIREVMLNLIK